MVIGITGTDGKTTTATLVYKILLRAGKKAALISTVSAKIGHEEIPTGLHVTSPDPWSLQRLLKKIARRKIEFVVLESTSHGLAQYRLFGIRFLAGVMTNVTHEHLDYHQTYEKYLAAKGKLFRKVEIAILNSEDYSFSYLNSVRPKKAKLVTYAVKKKADFTPKNFRFKTSLWGEFNQANCLAAIALTKSLGINDQAIRETIASFKGVTGRLEEINLGQNFRALVDFAHTPNGLDKALTTLSQKKKGGRLIAVFGCAGLRDHYKRAMMGKIAGRLTDIAVLTAEDPRTEDVNKIIKEIARGCLAAGAKELMPADLPVPKKGHFFFRVPDRSEAIKFAVTKLAKKGDIVVTCGKGHEQSMCYGQVEKSWSEHQELKKALKERLKNG